jgi:hypothetical protein
VTYLEIATVLFLIGITGTIAYGDEDHEHMALGEKCVEDTDFMRRNHMALLKHQREETVHDGIRTKKYSLRGCLECHAPTHPPDGGQPASIESGEHFCAECHVYTAIKIDCFECHAELGETAQAR